MLDLQRIVDDADLPPFEFIGVDGQPASLPHIKTLTARQAIRVLDGHLETVLREVAPESVDQILDLPAHATDALVKAWLAHSGESSASSRSSRRASTAGRSKATSRAGASKTSRR